MPTRQQMIDWIEERYNHLLENHEMVKNSFDVCGITSTDPEKIRGAEFFKQCMAKAVENIDDTEESEDDPYVVEFGTIENDS